MNIVHHGVRDNNIPFLDTSVIRDSNGLLTASVYRKPTSSKLRRNSVHEEHFIIRERNRNPKDAKPSGFLFNDLIMRGEGITTMAERLAEQSYASYGVTSSSFYLHEQNNKRMAKQS